MTAQPGLSPKMERLVASARGAGVTVNIDQYGSTVAVVFQDPSPAIPGAVVIYQSERRGRFLHSANRQWITTGALVPMTLRQAHTCVSEFADSIALAAARG